MNENIILLLDLDGVLITTPPWKADKVHADGYSDFNLSCVTNLNKLLYSANFDIWLSSTRRTYKTIDEFNLILKNRKVAKKISNFLPQYTNCTNRKEEIQKFITEFKVSKYLIIDDDKSLNGLEDEIKKNLVLTELTKGLNTEKLKEAMNLLQSNYT